MTGFPSASVLGWQRSRLPTDHVGMAKVSRPARCARPCRRQMRAFGRTVSGSYQPSSLSRLSSMPKWWAISWMTVRRTWSSTSCSVRQMAQIAGRQMVIRSGRTPAYGDVRLVCGMPRKARAGQAVPGGARPSPRHCASAGRVPRAARPARGRPCLRNGDPGPVMMPLGASVRSRKILAAWSTSTTGPGKRFRETRRSDAITALFSLARTWRIRSVRTSSRARLVPVVVSAMGMASLLSAF